VRRKKAFVFLAFLLIVPGVFSQISDHQELSDKIVKNSILFGHSIDEAYCELQPLISEAKRLQDTLAELTLLERKCKYFYSKTQIDSLRESSESLMVKSEYFKNYYFWGISYMYLGEAYSINNLPEPAMNCLEKALDILEKDKSGASNIFIAKANVLNSYANVYNDIGEPQKAVGKLHEVIKSYNKLKNIESIMRFQYVNYCNIAGLYSQFNMDSAEYFALKSMDVKPGDIQEDKIMMMNHYILGKVFKSRNDFENAKIHYYKAIDISKNIGVSLNLNVIYIDIIDLYKTIGVPDSVLVYENKLKDLEFDILQSKYNSLQKGIRNEQNGKMIDLQWYWFVIAFLMLGIGIFYVIRYNGRRKESKGENTQEIYNELCALIKVNDPAFLFAFEKAYPDFTEKLLAINPQLAKSEIEFCAMLKLNLSTKDIASYTFIEPRTVQNKKYRIRKRLGIPPSVDIYAWFDAF